VPSGLRRFLLYHRRAVTIMRCVDPRGKKSIDRGVTSSSSASTSIFQWRNADTDPPADRGAIAQAYHTASATAAASRMNDAFRHDDIVKPASPRGSRIACSLPTSATQWERPPPILRRPRFCDVAQRVDFGDSAFSPNRNRSHVTSEIDIPPSSDLADVAASIGLLPQPPLAPHTACVPPHAPPSYARMVTPPPPPAGGTPHPPPPTPPPS